MMQSSSLGASVARRLLADSPVHDGARTLLGATRITPPIGALSASVDALFHLWQTTPGHQRYVATCIAAQQVMAQASHVLWLHHTAACSCPNSCPSAKPVHPQRKHCAEALV